jgi:hypothetical protein
LTHGGSRHLFSALNEGPKAVLEVQHVWKVCSTYSRTHEHRCTLSRHCFFPTTRRRNKIMSQSNQLSCQTTFLHLLHGKVDTATLAEFHQLQV